MKKMRIAVLLAALMLPFASAYAVDTFDLTTGRVTIGSLVIGATEYRNIVLVPGSLVSFSTAPATATDDVFDFATGQLTIRSLTVNGVTYTNVVITVASLISVGSSVPVGTVSTTPVVPNDPLFPDQWHLKNTGQAGRDAPGVSGEDINVSVAWNTATGKGIQIAIIDDGLDIHHEDLAVVAGKSWDYRVNAYGDPSSGTSSHGTSCGGLAAAIGNNGIGVTGVAFDAKLVGYNLLAATTGSFGADSVTKDLGSNHIYSNSYGSTDSLGTLQPSDDAWQQAIETGISTGRGGKGAIYTWAAGNGAPTDRTDYDGQGNYHGVFAVGSLNDKGQKSSYSEPGSNLLVSAFGGEFCSTHTTTTVDVSGSAGYNDGTTKPEDYAGKPNYTRCMNGTSAATPEVSGVAALVLQTNPALTWRDVRLVLAKSARKNDPTNSDWMTNGGGMPINHNYGYGTVDATAAVMLAKTWVNIPAQKTATGRANQHQAIPDAGAAITSEISFANSGISKLEFVELRVTSNHADVGDLLITLTSPSNTVSTVAVPHECKTEAAAVVPCGSTLSGGFRFGVARLMGEVADGKWVLTVQDSKASNTGSLTSWDIKAMGY